MKKIASPQNKTAKTNISTTNISEGKSLPGLQQTSDNLYESKAYTLQAKKRSNINLNQEIVQYGGSKKKKKEWRTGSVDKELSGNKAKSKHIVHPIDSGHHKLPKSKLSGFYKGLNPLKLDKLHKDLGIEGEKGLLSLRSNLTLGPNSSLIPGDPGNDFDANTFSDGSLTPRSHVLSEAEGLIDKGGLSSSEIDQVILKLSQSEAYHKRKVPSGKIDEDVSMWRSSGDKTMAGGLTGLGIGSLAGLGAASMLSMPVLLPAIGLGLLGGAIGGYMGSRKRRYSKGAVDRKSYPK